MNESQKTGIFLGIAALTTVIATLIAWPSSSTREGGEDQYVNQELFPKFTDPLAAASLKIVVFDEARGEMSNFEVRRDSKTGQWTIPSRGGYPADAIDQMRDAANLMVGLKTLDAPTDNIEDHEGMGVIEPKFEELDLGDEGVGRLVTFKDDKQNVLASLIIGDKVPGTEDQIYVRKPGQDLVYAVQLDDSALSTKFIDWIEEDLLQLSSIDIDEVEIKDYSVALGLQGVKYNRKYSAKLKKDASRWELNSLKEYDENPLSPGTDVEVAADKQLNTRKLNELGNALDDLKFVNVLRKPEGISANLRAEKDFADGEEAATQLVRQGFLPVSIGGEQRELLSANGELTVTTKEGVQYILRFGNVIAEKLGGEEDSEESSDGVNRYLMVSTTVDESRFPLPELKPIPQTLEDLKALENPPPPPGTGLAPELNPGVKEDELKGVAPGEENASEDGKGDAEGEKDNSETPASDASEEEEMSEAPSNETTEAAAESEESGEPASEKSNEEPPSGEDSKTAEEASTEPSNEPETSEGEAPQTGETEASGEGESTTVGGGQETDPQAESDPPSEEKASTQEQPSEPQGSDGQGNERVDAEDAKPDDAGESKERSQDEPAEPAAGGQEDAGAEEMTEDEKLEQLATMQEKITKENERKLDQRKDKIEAAKRRSRELNDRFADWYYVIPEDTYTKLRISQEDLFDTSDAANTPPPGLGGPRMPIPGITPQFPQN